MLAMILMESLFSFQWFNSFINLNKIKLNNGLSIIYKFSHKIKSALVETFRLNSRFFGFKTVEFIFKINKVINHKNNVILKLLLKHCFNSMYK